MEMVVAEAEGQGEDDTKVAHESRLYFLQHQLFVCVDC